MRLIIARVRYIGKLTQERKRNENLPTSVGVTCKLYTGHTAHLGCMAGAGLQVTFTDVGRFSEFFLSCVSFPIYFQILSCSIFLQFARVLIPLQAQVASKDLKGFFYLLYSTEIYHFEIWCKTLLRGHIVIAKVRVLSSLDF